MEVEYIYCNCCGYEAFEEYVGFSRTCASGDLWICPSCSNECNQVEIGE